MWQEYVFPQSVPQALEVLGAYAGTARIIAGGTDLVIQLKEDDGGLKCLVDITRLQELRGITIEGSIISIGSAVTYREALASPLLQEKAPMLLEACREVGSPQIRNVGTLVGNIVNAQPAADAAIALLALDAEVEIASPVGLRREPLGSLFLDVGLCRVDPTSELVTKVLFRALGEDQGAAFERLAKRRALALPMLNVAAVVTVKGGLFQDARLAMGPVAPVPFRARKAEAFLASKPVNSESIAQAACLASEEAEPRTSVLRGSREYRKEMVMVYARRGLERAAVKWL